MRVWWVLLLVPLVGCAEPSAPLRDCTAEPAPAAGVVVTFLPPSSEVYDDWTIPEWSDYEVSLGRHASDGDAEWQHEGVLSSACLASPLNGAGQYGLTVTAPVKEDSGCHFISYEGFAYDGVGLLALERQIGAVCA